MTAEELRMRYNINEFDIEELADLIVEYIKDDFEEIYLSGNLRDTINITPTERGFEIEIPADRYNVSQFRKKGIVIYTGKGSYAEEVNTITGGYSGEHIDYVERGIMKAIVEWTAKHRLIGKVSAL